MTFFKQMITILSIVTLPATAMAADGHKHSNVTPKAAQEALAPKVEVVAPTKAAAPTEAETSSDGTYEVSKAWGYPTIMLTRPGIAFFSLKNTTDKDVKLIGVSANDAADRAEIHTHDMKDGIMRMRQLDSINLPSGSDLLFKPHSFHVMLFGLRKPLKVGDTYGLTLQFDDKTEKTTQVTVRPWKN